MLLATSLALWTNCLLATGLDVLEEASRQALHKAEVCLATIVAAERTLGNEGAQTSLYIDHPEYIYTHIQYTVYLVPVIIHFLF